MLINFNDLLFSSNKVNGIIHIGAHELEELPDYLKGNIKRIIWIEANPEKYIFIEEKLKNFGNMTLGKFAAGRITDSLILNLANNGQSSSLLEFGTHRSSYPNIDYISKIKVEVKPIDLWLDENIENKNLYNFINIDIQGYELEALKGMPNQLKLADYVYLEVNFEKVYLGCSELNDIDQFLLKFGFRRVGIRKTDKGWGDAIYSKNNFSISKLYYIFLPIIRIIKLPLTIYNFLIKLFKNLFLGIN